MELSQQAPMIDLTAFRQQVLLGHVDRVIVAPMSTDSADTLDVDPRGEAARRPGEPAAAAVRGGRNRGRVR